MDLDTAIAIAGGRVTGLANLRGAVSSSELDFAQTWITRLQEEYVDGFAQGAGSAQISLVLTRSPSLVLRTRPLDDGSVVILVPVGLIARTRFLAALLRSYPKKADIRVISSLLDDAPDNGWELATRLRPVFGEFVDDGDHWEGLAGLVGERAPAAELDVDLANICWVALTFVVMHEVAHVLRGHLTGLRKFDEGQLESAVTYDHSRFRRGLELDADLAGTELFLGTLSLLEAERLTEPKHRSGLFYLTGFAVTLLFGMYDARRKALGLYADGLYPHPLIRHEIWVLASNSILSETKPEWVKDWQREEYKAWMDCVHAFWNLDVDVFAGKFSEPPQQGYRCSPVTALNYSMFDAPFSDDQVQNELALQESVWGLLNALKQGRGSAGL